MTIERLVANWNYPTAIRAGVGEINSLPGVCQQLGIQSPLLVTDPRLAVLPMFQECIVMCQAAGLMCGVFCDLKSNPSSKNVIDGVAAVKAGQHDGIIALGGGSALDAGKAIALMAYQKGEIWDFEDIGDNWTRVNANGILPVIAVPTTAGTGSEVGRASVITDEENHLKRIIFHPMMIPNVVVLDPQLTQGLPPNLTAATGMDALSHALEAYCAPGYHPMADGIALEAMYIIKNWLPVAYTDGNNLEARTHMLTASMMGATAFQKGLGGMHALAHPIGARFDSHHGLLNAILMPYILQANQHSIDSRITRLARYLELEQPSFISFMQWILNLRRSLGIPESLSQIGINQSKSVEIGISASRDPSASGNPITFSAEQYSNIFRAAVSGDLKSVDGV